MRPSEVANLLQLWYDGDSWVLLSRVMHEVGKEVVYVGGASNHVTEQLPELELVGDVDSIGQASLEAL